MNLNKFIKTIFIGSFIIFIIILGLVFITGSTFGQRCAEKYEVNLQEWCNCVDSLANGI